LSGSKGGLDISAKPSRRALLKLVKDGTKNGTAAILARMTR